MKALILAGGRGTRLRPLTYICPKGLVPVANRPFLEYQLELLSRYGVRQVILSLNYMAEYFKHVLGDGEKWGLTLEYLLEDSPLGTGGAIAECYRFWDGEDRLVVLNGDVLTDIDLLELLDFHVEKESEITITVTEVSDPTSYGLVFTDQDGRVTRFIEKPGWDEVQANTINAGIYVIEKKGLDRIAQGVKRHLAIGEGAMRGGREISLERDLMPVFLEEGCAIYAYLMKEYWLDIGTLSKYVQAHHDILCGRVDTMMPGRKISRGVRGEKEVFVHNTAQLNGPVLFGQNVSIGPLARIGPFTTIGARARIGEGAEIVETIIHSGVNIGKDVRLTRCIVAQGVEIGDGCSLHSMVLGPGTVIGKGSCLFP
ncbi:MAG: NDP-sugar synthase [Firmicutes bacterium]|nr:NDP-sugar synthase [Bacillota bacterium]